MAITGHKVVEVVTKQFDRLGVPTREDFAASMPVLRRRVDILGRETRIVILDSDVDGTNPVVYVRNYNGEHLGSVINSDLIALTHDWEDGILP